MNLYSPTIIRKQVTFWGDPANLNPMQFQMMKFMFVLKRITFFVFVRMETKNVSNNN